MDEIDAALDFKVSLLRCSYKPGSTSALTVCVGLVEHQNVSIVAHYIKERTKNAQFIIISLRNNMFELADRLVGIYKTHVSCRTAAPAIRACAYVCLQQLCFATIKPTICAACRMLPRA